MRCWYAMCPLLVTASTAPLREGPEVQLEELTSAKRRGYIDRYSVRWEDRIMSR